MIQVAVADLRRLQELARCRVPELDQMILAPPGNQHTSIAREPDTGVPLVRGDGRLEGVRGDVPEADLTIIAGRGQGLAIGRKGGRVDLGAMSGERSERPAGGDLPEPHRAILA